MMSAAPPLRVFVKMPSGENEVGQLSAWTADAVDSNRDKLQLVVAGRAYEAESEEGFFDAMVQIRRRLESDGFELRCRGCCENVYPSPMSRSMGGGRKAYVLTLGKAAKTADLVDIFESSPDLIPATVDQQEEFYERWTNTPLS